MKKVIGLAILLLTLTSTTMAKEKGFDLEKEIVINVSAEKLWEMVGPGFTEVYKWASNVDHSVGKGEAEFEGATCNERFCDVSVKGFDKISEKLLRYSESNMNLAYAVESGMPNFITRAENDWTVVSLGDNKSKLVMKAIFRSKGMMGAMMNGMMKKKMTATLETVLNDAKIYAETGQISPAKAQRVAELEKKTKVAA